MSTIQMNPWTMLRRMFQGRRRELLVKQCIAEEVVLDAYEDVAREVETEMLKPIAKKAHAAETYDREAMRLIDDVLADGKVEPSEIAALKKARAMTSRSAECDHDTTDLAKFDAA